MKIRLFKAAAILFVAFTLFSCQKDPDDKQGEWSHTYIMYIIGGDYMISSYLNANVNEVQSAVTNKFPKGSKVYVYYHGYEGNNGLVCKLYELKPASGGATRELIEEYSTSRASTSGEAMAEILRKVKQLAPADTYGISFLGHGTGWFPGTIKPHEQRTPGVSVPGALEHDLAKPEDSLTRSFGPEPVSRTWGDISDMAAGIEGSGIDFEYILFDMCFMSSVEALYELRNSADYILAYPTEIMMRGAPHHKMIPVLFSADESVSYRDRLAKVCRVIKEYYETGGEGSLSEAYRGISATLVETSGMDRLAQAVKALFDNRTGDFDYTRINDDTYIQSLEVIANHAFFDLEDYLAKICGDAALTANFRAALGDVIVDRQQTPYIYSGYGLGGRVLLNRSCGISTYIPRTAYPVTRAGYYDTDWAKATQPGGWPY